MKKNNNKGFTLMEMLIVVAIIAILVAIAIPTFSNSLKKANQAADNANARAAYAEVKANAMLGETGTSLEKTFTAKEAYDGTKIGDVENCTWAKGNTVTVKADATTYAVTITGAGGSGGSGSGGGGEGGGGT